MFTVAPPALANTKAVVASWVVLVPLEAVGAVGTPVSAGDASAAFASSCVWIAEVTPSTKFSSAALVVIVVPSSASWPMFVRPVPFGVSVMPMFVSLPIAEITGFVPVAAFAMSIWFTALAVVVNETSSLLLLSPM